VRERSLWISTGITVLVLAGFLVLPSALGFGGATKATVVVVGPEAARVAHEARARQKTFDVALKVRTAADDAAARTRVDNGDADVAVLSGARVTPPLPVQQPGDSGASDRQGIALAAVVILYGQLLGYGFWVATGVVEEKSTRVVEILLSTIRPRQLLAGKVIGIGLLGIAQLLLIGAFGVVIGQLSGRIDVTGDLVEAVGVVLAWFVLGFGLYSCAFAVAGVPRQEEIQSVTAPLTIVILASFFLSFGALDDPGSSLARALSFVPPAAPMVMPVRMIAGDAAPWEVPASVAVTLLVAVAR
jgi:ABC-2 type transport system permease protein